MSWDVKDADEKFKDLSARGITYVDFKVNTLAENSIQRTPIQQNHTINN